ncbi:MAG: orotate phosphoribosyltransferase [Dehalococcoidia bacterium]
MVDELCAWGLLDEAGAAGFYRDGHFVYESGDHGDTWLALELLYARPRRLQGVAARLAEKLRPHAPDVVCGPLLGGAWVGQWVAHELDTRFVFAEPQPRSTATGPRYTVPEELHPALRDARVAIVDDVINAGAATLACVPAVEDGGGRVIAVASLLFRTPGTLDLWAARGIAVEYLLGVQWNTWPASDCPLCRAGVPVGI